MNELLLSSPEQYSVTWVLENCLLLSSPWCVFVARHPSTLLTCYANRKKRPWGQKKVAIVERFKEPSMYGLSAKLAFVERWPLVEVFLSFSR